MYFKSVLFTNHKCCIFVKTELSLLKTLLIKYRSVIRFVLLFLGSYFVLTLVYGLYLNLSSGGQYHPDFITELVATQCNEVINSFTEAHIVPHDTEPRMKLYVKDKLVASIIEGCNSVSLIILFVSFIIAFAQKFRKTLLFLFVGTVLIYTVNIFRIVFLAWALYTFPEYQHILHSVVFPGLIYGMIFLLWMLWVRMLNQKPTASHV